MLATGTMIESWTRVAVESTTPNLEKASAAEVAESVVVKLILDINLSELQGDVSEVDCERER
jgi:hypothetical protein